MTVESKYFPFSRIVSSYLFSDLATSISQNKIIFKHLGEK